jgi:site-specific DNA-adenine methylase
MAKSLLRYQLAALPTYFGGKRNHIRWLLYHLAKAVPKRRWPALTFLDAFMGGGSVSMAAKASGFEQVSSNDFSDRSQLIGQGVLVDPTQRFTRSDLLWLLQPVPGEAGPGLVESHYCPSVFSIRHARLLDQLLYWGAQIQNPVTQAKAYLLIWHAALAFVCFPTSLGASNRPYSEAQDGLRAWETLNPKRYWDGCIERLLQPSLDVLEAKVQLLNQGVFSGAPVTLSQLDALEFVRQTPGDIVYLDPPYIGTLRYEQSYAVLDHILTGKLAATPPSAFSTSLEALHPLLDACQHIPTWVLSFGNKEIDLPELMALVQRHAGSRTVQGYAKHCKHLAHVSKNPNNQELLIIASSEREVISYAH